MSDAPEPSTLQPPFLYCCDCGKPIKPNDDAGLCIQCGGRNPRTRKTCKSWAFGLFGIWWVHIKISTAPPETDRE